MTKKIEMKKYICPQCKNEALEYTGMCAWRSKEPYVIKREVKCPKCGKIFWVKDKKGN